MRQVTKAEFFAFVNPLNVFTRVDMQSLKGRYHASDWLMQDYSQALIGRSESDSHGSEPTKFFLI